MTSIKSQIAAALTDLSDSLEKLSDLIELRFSTEWTFESLKNAGAPCSDYARKLNELESEVRAFLAGEVPK